MSGKSSSTPIVVVLVGIIIVLMGIILWLFQQPKIADLTPPNGVTSYLLAVNNKADPKVYSPSGRAWVECTPETCMDESDTGVPLCEPTEKGFCLEELRTKSNDSEVMQKSAQQFNLEGSTESADTAMSVSLFPEAQALTSDNVCPVIGLKFSGSTIIRVYPSPQDDPDCPPM